MSTKIENQVSNDEIIDHGKYSIRNRDRLKRITPGPLRTRLCENFSTFSLERVTSSRVDLCSNEQAASRVSFTATFKGQQLRTRLFIFYESVHTGRPPSLANENGCCELGFHWPEFWLLSYAHERTRPTQRALYRSVANLDSFVTVHLRTGKKSTGDVGSSPYPVTLLERILRSCGQYISICGNFGLGK